MSATLPDREDIVIVGLTLLFLFFVGFLLFVFGELIIDGFILSHEEACLEDKANEYCQSLEGNYLNVDNDVGLQFTCVNLSTTRTSDSREEFFFTEEEQATCL